MIYKVTLKPLDYFFFGTSKKYIRKKDIDIGNKIDNNYLKPNYNIDSYLLPQQTSLLGMLRKQILKWSGEFNVEFNYKNKENNIVKLIGERGFEIDEKLEFCDYGIIKCISPVFIDFDKKSYYKGPFDIKYRKDKKTSKNLKLDEAVTKSIKKVSLNGNIVDDFIVQDYDAKLGLTHCFINLESPLMDIKSFEDLFVSESMIQVKIDNRDENDDPEMFRKKRYKLKDGATFSFFVDIDDNGINFFKKDNSNIVYLGGEKSAFEINLEKIDLKNNANLNFENQIDNMNYNYNLGLDFNIECNNVEYRKIYCKSDIYLEKSDFDFLYSNLKGGNIFYTDFNCFSQSISSQNKKNTRNKLKENRYKIIERGSYFIVEKSMENEMFSRINKYKSLKQMGYNIIIRGEQNGKENF